jgi:hypothetical protein
MDGAHRGHRAMIRRVARDLDAWLDDTEAGADDDQRPAQRPSWRIPATEWDPALPLEVIMAQGAPSLIAAQQATGAR